MRLPDLRKLRHVTAVARAGSFTSAANLLAITQSALTKSVADVEDQAGIRIFERLPRGVRVTDAGAMFIARAERLLADAGDLMADVESLNELRTGQLRLGVAPGAFVTFLESTVSAYARVYPGVRVEVTSGTIDEMARALLNGRIDLCVTAAGYMAAWKELEVDVIAPLRHFFIGRKDHPAARTGKPRAKALLAYPVVLPEAGLSTEAMLVAAYQDAGLSPAPPHYVCNHFPLVTRIVAVTDAISPVVTFGEPPARFVDQFTIFDGIIRLEQHELGIATERTRPRSAASAAFADIFSAFVSSVDAVVT